jgi:4-hydroxy-2-oxoheptanedioate aldolase
VQNHLRVILESGEAIINGWLSIPSGFSAEVMARCGFDSITVDLQHGVQDYQSMVHCFQAMQPHPITPLVRIPSNEPGIIGKVLDAGACGVICPMINTSQDAEAFVAYSKYPPRGTRSNGPVRAALYSEAGRYQEVANDETFCIPMLETRTAVENMDDIVKVDGVAGIYVGPADLGFSYGLSPRLDREEPEILAIYGQVLRTCERQGIFAGIHTGSPAYALRAIKMGFRFVTIMSDANMLAQFARAAVAQMRSEREVTARP